MDEQTTTDEGSRTLVESVMATIRHRIAARSLTPGMRLPSIRAFAKAMQVSKSTVVEAYERLAAEGMIRSRPGSGFYAAGQLAPLSLAEIGPRLDRAVDPLWVSRQSLEAGDGVLKPGCGWLPASWMPEAGLRRALRTMARADDAALTDYGTPLGLPALRHLLARRMAEHGIEASPDQIMLTESGTQAIDLLCRFLLEPGDTVLVDDPCYFNFHALLRAHRAKVISVPYTRSGPDIELFADFEHTPAPRLAAFDGLSRVIHVGSFSKTLSASVRCGFIAAPRDWMEGLTDLKIATSFGSGRLASELVLALLKDGLYRKHVDLLRARLSRAMEESSTRLRAIGIMPWIDQPAGMFLWCRLPEGIDAADVARHALSANVVLAPGNAFSLSRSASRYMRFNVAQSGGDRIFRALEDAMSR
ncbi:PLP-dependent aminotransferase family protein [Mesorhizobium sp. M1328]|uniref:aminotransferase-like domain-containing protein n=1 Tax=Mesorhizobium sp. M1328 TaxID=2957082 RepID=UPI00333802CC